MIRNIVFDMGNVLVLYDPEISLKEMGVSAGDISVLMKEVFGSFEWAERDRGTIGRDEAFAAMTQRLPERLADIISDYALNPNYMEIMPPFPEMKELAKGLKEAGYGLYLLSNASEDFYDYSKNYPVIKLMDGIIVSSDYNTVKPEPEIYRIMFEKFGLSPGECFFIDDMRPNVDGAKTMGMDGVCFSPSREPVSELIKIMRDNNISI